MDSIISNLNSSFSGNETKFESRPSAAQIWGIGLFAVTIINSCAIIGISIMPLLGKSSYNYLLTVLIGLAVGSLSGSAIFHLLPEAFELPDESKYNYIRKCWTAIAGVYLFFLVDKFLKIFVKYRKQKKHCSNSDFGPISMIKPEKPPISNIGQHGNLEIPAKSNKVAPSSGNVNIGNGHADKSDSTGKNVSGGEKKELKEKEEHGNVDVAPVAYMVIFGDAIHNFVDGLSIGAAFTESLLSGVSVCVAVICEEFPHEFGDVAIMVNSGMTIRQALCYNMLSAATCYAGFVIGVAVGDMPNATIYIFALASGMFIYVALASMVPEMNDTMERAMDTGIDKGLFIVFLQCIGIAAGLVIMFLLTIYHSHIRF